ncbi:Pre-rRNA-processing protein IPI3 [Labeo rohita]|uniref:Pre-rRNA-processing protein IPI3 n=1 Tax=Labeo rohita TaxID=84645 RepID=A0ABQ8MKT2_LABRO|nr:Pre-rRNA-processing protein IPI3 [Labeo rohita]
MSSAILGYLRRLCWTRVLNSSPMSGKPSASNWVSLLTYLLVIIHRQTARLRGRSKSSGATSGHTAKKINTAGAGSSRGPSTHRIPSARISPAKHPSSAYSVISHRCFPGQRSPRMFQLLTTGSEQARECGTQLTIISSRQSVVTKVLLTPDGGRRPNTNPGTKFSFSSCHFLSLPQTPLELKLNPLLPKCWPDHPSTLSMRSWIYGAEEAAWNISSTARVMDQRSDPG